MAQHAAMLQYWQSACTKAACNWTAQQCQLQQHMRHMLVPPNMPAAQPTISGLFPCVEAAAHCIAWFSESPLVTSMLKAAVLPSRVANRTPGRLMPDLWGSPLSTASLCVPLTKQPINWSRAWPWGRLNAETENDVTWKFLRHCTHCTTARLGLNREQQLE